MKAAASLIWYSLRRCLETEQNDASISERKMNSRKRKAVFYVRPVITII
jgi:hypothetical protein